MTQVFVTPNRRTRIVYDQPESVCTSDVWFVKRRGADICHGLNAGGANDAQHQNLKVWPTGAITLTPLQSEITQIQEYAVGISQILGTNTPNLLAINNVADNLAVENRYRQNDDLPGFVASTNIASAGSPYIVKKVAAGDSWDNVLSSGVAPMLGDALDIPVDRVGEGLVTYPADQAFFLSWALPGAGLSFPQWVMGFYFGQYGISFSGSGTARLYENAVAASDNSFSWQLVDSWKYAKTSQLSGTTFSMQIWPHVGPDGSKYIAFTNGQVDYAQRFSSFARSSTSMVAPGDRVFTAKYSKDNVDQSPGHATMAGPIRFDIRRDLRLELQISTLGWPATGFVIDDPATLPPQNPHFPIITDTDMTVPPGTSITPTLLDAATGMAFDPTVDGDPAGRHCQARFDFASDGVNTPILWGYGLRRDPDLTIVSPGEFSGGNIRHVNVIGYSGDPAQQSASVMVKDLSSELGRLANRGQIRATIYIDHQEDGTDYTTPIFSGYVMRPEGTKKGKPGRSYPSPGAYDYDLSFQGMWVRLAEKSSGPVIGEIFAKDLIATGDDPDGTVIPWKVTDALSYLLQCAGFALSQIALPDFDARCWFGVNSAVEELTVQPGTDYSEMAMQLCRNYLGLHLCYAEELDAWVLITPLSEDVPALYNFVTAPSASGKLSAAPGAYGPLTTFITGSLRTQVVKPEFTGVHVMTGIPDPDVNNKTVIESYYYNYAAAPMHGASYFPDPNNPEFVGRILMVEVIDPSLYVGAGQDTAEATQTAVDWTCRRIYNFCCHAQRLAFFRAPLVFVLDPLTNLYRMPRFLDPITINGAQYVVKACNPDYTWDGAQMANYECIQPFANQYIPPGIEALTFFRRTERQQNAKRSGHSTESPRIGGLSIAPQAEHIYRHLPRNIAFQRRLQDPQTGQPYFMLGMDTLGTAPLSP